VADDLKDNILSIFEAALEAQLRAVRRLRQGPQATPARPPRQGMSQVDMAFDILKKARTPLHVSVILEHIQASFGVTVDRESLVSSLSKKVERGDRFIRTEKNTFALLNERK
jgi:HB1, ASXL, restriction endonuclease HTH domain